jgi:hypothetical protein
MSSSADSLETASASTATPRGEPDPAAAVAEALLPERAVTEVRGCRKGAGRRERGCGVAPIHPFILHS